MVAKIPEGRLSVDGLGVPHIRGVANDRLLRIVGNGIAGKFGGHGTDGVGCRTPILSCEGLGELASKRKGKNGRQVEGSQWVGNRWHYEHCRSIVGSYMDLDTLGARDETWRIMSTI